MPIQSGLFCLRYHGVNRCDADASGNKLTKVASFKWEMILRLTDCNDITLLQRFMNKEGATTTLIVFKNGKPVAQQVGAVGKGVYAAMLDKAL